MAAIAPTEALYRALVPAHGAVAPATVEVFLGLAVEAHTKAAFGARYDEAMVYFAAHRIERTPGLVNPRYGRAAEVGAVSSLNDSQSTQGKSSSLSKSLTTHTGSDAEEAELLTTRYGSLYLSIRRTRAARAPCVVRQC